MDLVRLQLDTLVVGAALRCGISLGKVRVKRILSESESGAGG
jgi:hypothetical protein